jgi:hypothetical protein
MLGVMGLYVIWPKKEQGAKSGMSCTYLLAGFFYSHLRFQELLTLLLITARRYDI